MINIYLINRYTGRSTLLISYYDIFIGICDSLTFEHEFNSDTQVIDFLYEE